MNESFLEEDKIFQTTQLSELTQSIFRSILMGIFVPLICVLPELMVVKKQLELRTTKGPLIVRHPTISTFLSGAKFGWVSGGLKAITYGSRDIIYKGIEKIHGDHKKINKAEIDKILTSLVVGAIDAITTHGPSSMRALSWTNPKALREFRQIPFLQKLIKIYKIAFTTRIFKTSVNAGCYIAFTPWIERNVKLVLPENLGNLLAVLASGTFSGFMCTSLDIISAHIYKETIISNKIITAPSLLKMSQMLYHQNGLKIFFCAAPRNAVVSALAFGTMLGIEHLVSSKPFANAYQESIKFFKRASDKNNIENTRFKISSEKQNRGTIFNKK